MSANAAIDYAALLTETLPRVIHSDAQNEQYAARLEEIVFKDILTPAEEELVELLTLLIEEYERRRFPVGGATPNEVLAELIAAHELRQKDLADVFGAESTVSAILNGKRPLTRDHIEKLSKRFSVSPAVFF